MLGKTSLQNTMSVFGSLNTWYISAGWWFQICFIFTPIWGRFPIWRAYFSIGLVQPPTSIYIYNHLPPIKGTKNNHCKITRNPSFHMFSHHACRYAWPFQRSRTRSSVERRTFQMSLGELRKWLDRVVIFPLRIHGTKGIFTNINVNGR